jgi:hypothetical protein
LLSGIAYFKYSFAPSMALFLLFRRGVRSFALSLVPVIAGTGLVWLWITGGRRPLELVRLLVEPLAVAHEGFRPDAGDPNLMNILDHSLHGRPEGLVNGVEIAVALAVCLVISYFAFRRNPFADISWQMSLMAVMSYSLFKHHTYDAVVLLLPLAYALSRWQERSARVLLGLIGYLFFFERVLQAAHMPAMLLRWPAFVVLMAALAVTYNMGSGFADVEEEVLTNSPARARRVGQNTRVAA